MNETEQRSTNEAWREQFARAEAAESALAELRARIAALREEWRDSAKEMDHRREECAAVGGEGNNAHVFHMQGRIWLWCADNLSALLDPPVRKEP